MPDKPEFDIVAVHKYFSAHCFNAAWDLIEKTNRTAEEDEEMIRLCQTSIYHWTQREDCTDQSLSIGFWQASRAHSLLNSASEAEKYGQLCLDKSKDLDKFFLGYAYEALARAAMVTGDAGSMNDYLEKARECVGQVEDESSKKMLVDDLDGIKL